MDRRIAAIVLATVAGTLLIGGLALVALIYSGEYNVAASKPHYRLVEWALATTMERSVRDHAAEVEVPPLSDSALLRTGFDHFEAMCVTCHGAPGVERSEIGKGLTPEPPELSREIAEWSPAELYWIVKHGIKMTGMPAFGATHDDRALWGIVAFLLRLPEISPEEYRAMREAGGGGHGAGGHPHGDEGAGSPGQQHSHGASGHPEGTGAEPLPARSP